MRVRRRARRRKCNDDALAKAGTHGVKGLNLVGRDKDLEPSARVHVAEPTPMPNRVLGFSDKGFVVDPVERPVNHGVQPAVVKPEHKVARPKVRVFERLHLGLDSVADLEMRRDEPMQRGAIEPECHRVQMRLRAVDNVAKATHTPIARKPVVEMHLGERGGPLLMAAEPDGLGLEEVRPPVRPARRIDIY
eukprot:Amastigsp_a509264_6.p2 type:complete len:191 gc:universal Amastigsp_a509264_6:237-809(+)